MRVKLQVNFFEHREYEVVFQENLLIFKSKVDEKRIVISDILTVNLSATATRVNEFVLETAEKRYKGAFLLSGDAEQFVAKITTESGRLVQMNYTEEPPSDNTEK